MSSEIVARCKHCGTELPRDYVGSCPYCGKTGKEVISSLAAFIGIEAISEFEGIYEVPEAARYIAATTTILAPPLKGITSRNLIYWIRAGLPLPNLANVPAREILINFEDVVSMRIIALLRAAGISFRKIREAERYLHRLTGYPRPFATKAVWVGCSHIFAEFEALIIAASKSGQVAMDFIKDDLKSVHGLSFDKHDVAYSWTPHTDVRLTPTIQFGRPCVDDTRIPTRSLAGMFRAGDSVEFIAESYQIAVGRVENALDWEESLVVA